MKTLLTEIYHIGASTVLELVLFYYFCFVLISRHLDGAVLETLSRPMLLITDAYNAMMVQARRKERDQALFSKLR